MTALPRLQARRGWCPGVRRPMETGDGLLVRIHPAGGALSAAQLRLAADTAEAHGNGLLDISARGNLQIRGVTHASYPALLDTLDAAGLAEPEGSGPPRLTLVSPLAGLDPEEAFDSLALAAAIEAEAVPNLPAKVFVAIDGGGRFALDATGADLFLISAEEPGLVTIGLATHEGYRWIGGASSTDAPDAVHALLASFAEQRGEARRMRDLGADAVSHLIAQTNLIPARPRALPRTSPRAGLIPFGTISAFLAALPFGRASAAQLRALADACERFGSGSLRLSFTRGCLVPSIDPRDAAALADIAQKAGFITDVADPRLAVSACPGRPACASAWTTAPADAAQLARLLPGGVTLHVSGCAKGCAHPAAASLTLVGVESGLYDVVPNGTTRDRAVARLTIDSIMHHLARDGSGAFRETAS